ncbi:MAG: hypothetical protein ABSE51_07740 [Terracidiphilus sp.]|jgi:hypothetical protein
MSATSVHCAEVIFSFTSSASHASASHFFLRTLDKVNDNYSDGIEEWQGKYDQYESYAHKRGYNQRRDSDAFLD